MEAPEGTVVSIDGELVDPAEAVVSVFDRGFLYGDSIYEVIRTYRSVPFELESHLARLEGSGQRIGMALPVPLEVIGRETQAAQRATGHADCYLRIVVSRGAGPIGLDPELAEDPRRIVIAMPVKLPAPEVYEKGAKVVLTSVRRNLRDAIDPRAKTGNYLNSVMALGEAKRKGAFEAIMLDHRDFVTEGASSNVFAVVGGVILTPPVDLGLLEGVTRSVVMKIAKRNGIPLLEVPLTEPALKAADEVFITSSIREVVPIVQVDETVIGTGTPGKTTGRIRELFAQYVEDYVRSHT